jgi:hypothetical protein
MSGFATVNREVVVTTGQNVNLSFPLKVSTRAEEVTVTAETPVVDTKRVGTATTLTKEELAQVPQSRDPWAVLKTVPGVLVDRANVEPRRCGDHRRQLERRVVFVLRLRRFRGDQRHHRRR